MTFLSTDKINVFVSSRLGECAEERRIAMEAVESLAHQAIMFEAAGARQHAPRTVYLRGLEESQIFIGIYREGYGYIADGMDISGIEDEYRYSKSLGLPQLLYVKRGAEMDERQAAFVKSFTDPSITVAYYENCSDLAEKIRDNLAAMISEYFRRGQTTGAISPPNPGSVANQLVPVARRIRRKLLEEQLLETLKSNPVVLVSGSMGAGKTVFMSSLAEKQDWGFVQCADRSPSEILIDATNSIRMKLEMPAKGYIQISEAQSGLKAAWQACSSVTLVMDDVRTLESIELIRSVISENDRKRVVIISREVLQISGEVFRLPPLDIGEIKELVLKNRSAQLLLGELEELHRLSEGNPLYLRYYLNAEPGKFEKNIVDYELKSWTSLSPEAQEALSYLAWTTRPLTLEELSELLTGSTESVEVITKTMDSAMSFLVDSNRGYAIFHPHAMKTIRDVIARSSARLSFYSNRLSRWFSEKHDYSAAFNALHMAGFDVPKELLELAGRHAAVQGDVKTATKILNIQISVASKAKDLSQERDLLLMLAQMQSHAGQTEEAIKTIETARSVKAKTEPPIDMDVLLATIIALTKGDVSAIEQLKEAKSEYVYEDRDWDAARLAIDISAIYIHQGEYHPAANEAEYAKDIFTKNNDKYGLRIAKMNLLSALSGLPERFDEAETLLNEIEAEGGGTPRQRALICNVLGRNAREHNDIDGAKNYAREAIEIGRNLGDVGVVCNNLINLGNAFRQEKDWESAVAEYEAADKLARESHFVITEAKAQELLATVCNRTGDGERAIHHANYAISLVKNGVSERGEANATEELAEALEITRDDSSAWKAWLRYSDLESKYAHDNDAKSYGFIRAASLLQKHRALRPYIDSYRNLFDGPFPDIGRLSPRECLIEDIVILLNQVSLAFVFDAAVYHSRLSFDGLPKLFVRRMFLRMIERLFDSKDENAGSLKRQRIALALSMAVPPFVLTMGDIADIGKRLSKAGLEISYRPHSDGASHWALNIPLGRPVMITISQLDDREDVSLITLCLALVLVSFAPDIFEDVLSGVPPLRNEANIQVSCFDEIKELVPLENIGLTSLDEGCAVTRSTDVNTDTGVPIVVLTSNKFTENWLVGSGRGNSGQELFAKVLVELIYHLQAGEIDLESLYPKVITVVKRTIV